MVLLMRPVPASILNMEVAKMYKEMEDKDITESFVVVHFLIKVPQSSSRLLKSVRGPRDCF